MTRTTHCQSVTHAAPHLRSQSRLRGRLGVTLIELLVVLAIIGILLALTAAALQKTAEGQNVKSSTDQVFKLQQALDLEYERVVQQCATDSARNQIPTEFVNFCEGDKARAKAVWTAFKLRLNFPQTFTEANTPLVIQNASGGFVYAGKPLKAFDKVQGLTSGLVPPNEESGALLYLILIEKSVSGGGAMATGGEDLSQAMTMKVSPGGRELPTFADAWKRSIGFERWAKSPEINAPPYIDPQQLNSLNKDVLDPQDKVRTWSPTGTAPINIVLMKRDLGFGDVNAVPPTPGDNRLANVYSLGRTTVVRGTVTPTPLDDILGFRLHRKGAKGNLQ